MMVNNIFVCILRFCCHKCSLLSILSDISGLSDLSGAAAGGSMHLPEIYKRYEHKHCRLNHQLCFRLL